MNKKRIVIAGALRTPIGLFGRALWRFSSAELMAEVFRAIIEKVGIDPKNINNIIVGSCEQPTNLPNLAKISASVAGLPSDISAFSIQMNCGSGLKAIAEAYKSIRAGEDGVYLVGGTESLSRVPYYSYTHRMGEMLRLKNTPSLIDPIPEGLRDPIANKLIGSLGEEIVKKYKITKEEQDRIAMDSYQKALEAWKENKYLPQIVPINTGPQPTSTGYTRETIIQDEGLSIPLNEKVVINTPPTYSKRNVYDLNQAICNKLEPEEIVQSFDADAKSGTITSSNSARLADGTAGMLVLTEEKAEKLKITPQAEIISYKEIAFNPNLTPEGIIYVIPKILEDKKFKIEDIDVFEINEEFAFQNILCQRILNIPEKKINPWGGGIILGCPFGAMGAIMAVKLVHILDIENKNLGLTATSISGGQANALILKKYQ